MPPAQAVLKEITRLLASWPGSVAGDADEQLRSYLLAIEDFESMLDIEAGVNALIKGTAPGINPSFLPPPAALGAEVRRQNHLRCHAEDRARKLRPALPPPDIEKDAASRARVAALVADVTGKLRTDEAEGVARHKAALAKSNEAWDAERGFTVGDKIGQEDAA